MFQPQLTMYSFFWGHVKDIRHADKMPVLNYLFEKIEKALIMFTLYMIPPTCLETMHRTNECCETNVLYINDFINRRKILVNY